MKKTTKNTTNFTTLTDVIFKNIKDVKKSWGEQKPDWNDIHNAVNFYDGKIDLNSLLYWAICGQVDTAVRPVLANVIDLLAKSNCYAIDCSLTMGQVHKLFMTGIKKTQIRSLCKAVCMGACACDGDEEEFVKILTNFYCDMSILERIEFLETEIEEYPTLVKARK